VRITVRIGAGVRRVAAALAALGIVTGAAAAGVVALDVPAAHAADSRAVVVVDTGGGVHRTVVSFSGSITGLQALQLAGANPATYGYAGQGAAVCALDGVGHEASQGACLGTLDDPRYWAYFRSPAGSSGWSYSRSCACTTAVHDGDVEGWRYGTGQSPPYSSFCSVAGCAPPPTAAPPTAPPATAAPAPSVQGTAVTAPPGGGSNSVGPPGATSGPGSGGGASATTAGGAAGTATGDASTSTTPAGDGSDAPSTRRGTDQRALGASGGGSSGGGSSGGGSPWGVVAAAVVVVGLAGGAWWIRRSRAPGARPG
jgi:hypothetical protein